MIRGKKILLGVSGSIAAYKSAFLIRLLVKQGAEVKVVITPSAADFISPLTLATLSGQPVHSELSTNDTWANHVALGRWADLMLIAPLSCNTLAKMAHGLCDNLLMAVYLSATCPVAVAPAMDEDMWLHPATKKNIAMLAAFGNHILPVENGSLASGLIGQGRMSEPEAILSWIEGFFLTSTQFKGKKVLITAGPTYEKIDPVRFIGNHSSGKMGFALATAFLERGADVTLVLGPTIQNCPSGITVIHVESAADMYDAVMREYEKASLIVMAAAVADFSVEHSATDKIKKSSGIPEIKLVPTRDILKKLGEVKRPDQVLVGFALETENEKAHALEKLRNKNADFIILNSMRDAGAGFGQDTNKITIFDKQGREWPFETKSKKEVAADIINTIMQG